MMKKLFSIFFALCMIFSLFPANANFGNYSYEQISAKVFQDVYTQGNNLMAVTTISYETVNEITTYFSDNVMSVSGQIVTGRPFDISIFYASGQVTSAMDTCNSYEVLSISQFDGFIRIVLQDYLSDDILYIDIHGSVLPTFESYLLNWYDDLVVPIIVHEPTITPLYEQNFRTRTYTSTSEVLGEEYKEVMEVQIEVEYPNSITPNTPGVFFSSLSILSSKTTHTAFNGNVTVQNGNSLRINDIKMHVATPKNEYIRWVDVNCQGTRYDSGGIYMNFELSIPKTPLSIGVDLPEYQLLTSGMHGDYSFPPTSEGGVMAACFNWDYILSDGANSSSSSFGDFVDVQMTILVDEEDLTLGAKALPIRWEYVVTSSGDCNGVAVNLYRKDETQNMTMAHMLVNS